MADLQEFESRILSFESAWQSGTPPVLADFLPAGCLSTAAQCLPLLTELVCIDLEGRWRNAAGRRGPWRPLFLDDYVRQFPELGPVDELPLELIGEEYRVRQCWGDSPRHGVFLTRFPSRQEQVGSLLRRIDDELRVENEDTLVPACPPGPAQPFHVGCDSEPQLDYADYVLQQMVGAGRMGKVYRAWQRSLGRQVAVKFLRKGFLRQAEAVERFVSEARIVSCFRHPGLARVHGLGRTPGGGYFIVMDLVDGTDLARVVDAGPVAVWDAVEWITQACDAVEHAHQHGIVHCDLKPGNLLLDRRHRIVVTDFGLARPIAEDRTVDRGIEGTAAFMAPEQVSRYWGPVGRATDVYGLGAVLYALLTRQPPWQGRTPADVLSQVVSGAQAVSPHIIRPELPHRVAEVCLRCLVKQPGERYSTAAQLRNALQSMSRISASLP